MADIVRKRTKAPVTEQSILQYGKIPPQAVELEEVVLGAMMLEKDALANVIEILKAEVFYKEAHQHIFTAISHLFNSSQPVDILTVTNELKTMAKLDIAGGPYYIAQLTSKVASSANIEYHSRIILQKFIQRELIRISGEISTEAFEDTTDVFELLDKAERNLFDISETNLRRKYSSIQDILKEAIGEIEKAKEAGKNSDFATIGVPTGYTGLDRLTAGWQKSDLIILAGRPSMGKTAFVLSMARNAAIDYGIPVAIFSLEMSAIQLVLRLISMETELQSDSLRRGKL
ncbi:MAG TPA: DnaB-like helicase N-terminal domain-containing protein, partial [Bacteroidales bacterium]|nr:DnaB-like helicase N-terminal domain-containing protein [Bacteroidales bacterium]